MTACWDHTCMTCSTSLCLLRQLQCASTCGQQRTTGNGHGLFNGVCLHLSLQRNESSMMQLDASWPPCDSWAHADTAANQLKLEVTRLWLYGTRGKTAYLKPGHSSSVGQRPSILGLSKPISIPCVRRPAACHHHQHEPKLVLTPCLGHCRVDIVNSGTLQKSRYYRRLLSCS